MSSTPHSLADTCERRAAYVPVRTSAYCSWPPTISPLQHLHHLVPPGLLERYSPGVRVSRWLIAHHTSSCPRPREFLAVRMRAASPRSPKPDQSYGTTASSCIVLNNVSPANHLEVHGGCAEMSPIIRSCGSFWVKSQ